MKDKLIKCAHCGSELCYSYKINERAWANSCTGCGFTASDLVKTTTINIDEFEETLPELYKDIKYIDDEDRVWYPMVINNEKGVVFIDGTNKENWQWAGIKNRKLTDLEIEELVKEEKEVPPYKSDASTLEHFGQAGFLQATNYINGI